ncbi:hypothetical protein PoB_001032400 [Plakobranchus ocellatus]|uniref:Uncharacterized protein n=1 Tax=Plakobranchus ocellatus TaxID=259542 RepID=A0AAV3YLB9_9GAST|nr:hypothetical protein PoB_001032400 [Plakobranchus ocellatus]
MATIQAPNSPSEPVQDTNAHIRQEGNKGANKAGMHMQDPDQTSQCLYAPHTSQDPPTVELSHPASQAKAWQLHFVDHWSRKQRYQQICWGKKEVRGANIHTLPPRRRRANPIRKGLISL